MISSKGQYLVTDGSGETLVGGEGNDTLVSGTGGDNVLIGGDGTDAASYELSAVPVLADLAIGVAITLSIDTLSEIENLIGSQFDDVLNGDASSNWVSGGDGNDMIVGRDGKDTLVGGLGDDTLVGGEGIDAVGYGSSATAVVVDLAFGTASGQGHDLLNSVEEVFGSAFADLIKGDASDNWLHGNLGDDTLIGGAGVDTASYVHAAAGVTVNLATGVASGEGNDQLSGIEAIDGSSFADTLIGNTGANVLRGREGNDSLSGGDGKDSFAGGLGDDTLDGGNGIDAVSYSSSESGVIVDLAAGTASGEGNDLLHSIEEISGSRFSDRIMGDAANNWLHGGLGDDTLIGGEGVDTASYVHAASGVAVNLTLGVASGEGADQLSGIEAVDGSSFDDTLIGDAAANRLVGRGGDDFLQGGGGNDTLEGGAGADHFVYSAAGGDGSGFDVIRDFQSGVDILHLIGFGFDDTASVLAASHEIGSDTVIELAPTASLTILGLSLSQLDENIDLLFG